MLYILFFVLLFLRFISFSRPLQHDTFMHPSVLPILRREAPHCCRALLRLKGGQHISGESEQAGAEQRIEPPNQRLKSEGESEPASAERTISPRDPALDSECNEGGQDISGGSEPARAEQWITPCNRTRNRALGNKGESEPARAEQTFPPLKRTKRLALDSEGGSKLASEEGAIFPLGSIKKLLMDVNASGLRSFVDDDYVDEMEGDVDEKFYHSPDLKVIKDSLRNLVIAASNLLRAGFYRPFITAISYCKRRAGSFIVLDCPSGSGKSMAGVALLLHDKRISEGESNYRVAHVVWPSAVDKQDIYLELHELQEKAGVKVSEFYNLMREMMEGEHKEEQIWERVLRHIFCSAGEENITWAVFVLSGVILVLFLDEIPDDPEEVAFIGKIRDMLKGMIVVILSGTNSNLANMVGVSNSKTISTQSKAGIWSILISRLPKFMIECSAKKQIWDELLQVGDRSVQDVVRTIQASIKRKGNPRLINFAIDTLHTLLGDNCRVVDITQDLFFQWQALFSSCNLRTKFVCASPSQGFSRIVAQANLLLSANCDSSISDVWIQAHYAHRAVPDQGKTVGSCATSKFSQCGGILYVCPAELRALGKSLYFNKIASEGYGVDDWQRTVFADANDDPLLYLSCCWENGYLNVCGTGGISGFDVSYTAYAVVKALWSSNAFEHLNFQNSMAPVNPGSFKEVLVVLALFNAAAKQQMPQVSLGSFLIAFMKEMEISLPRTMKGILQNDRAWNGLTVKRLLFPGRKVDCMDKSLYGTVLRLPNIAEADVLFDAVDGVNELGAKVSSMLIEAKDTDQFCLTDLVRVAAMVVLEQGAIGIIVLRESTNWFSSQRSKVHNKFEKLKKAFRDAHLLVGTVFFVSSVGHINKVCISEASGRLIVIQLPELSNTILVRQEKYRREVIPPTYEATDEGA